MYTARILYFATFSYVSRELKKEIYVWPLTTLVLVKVMKVYFPFPLSVHHVAEELFVIQQAIFVCVIRINDILGEGKTLQLARLWWVNQAHAVENEIKW